VLERIGGGGMGVVYGAYDPELDRKLAVKLLRAEATDTTSASEGRTRLLREAQAMARLSHPNVIAVHDVGTLDDEVFVAMEFVDGTTLERWRSEKTRSVREVLAVFVQAGRGLEAAHAAGIIHRDFKPENCIMGRDGRVRVLDFGLARAAATTNEPAQPVTGLPPVAELPTGATPREDALATPLTREGAVVGTPAYMTPEQFLGQATDARSDQFSFCAALYEALYGELPFSAGTVKDLAMEVVQGRVREAPKESRVPGWLRQVVLRGLSVRPEERFPSMHELLAALTRDPRAARRRWLAAAAALAVVGAAALGYQGALRRHASLCRGGADKLAGLWDAGRRNAVRAAFEATGKPFSADAFAGVARTLDAYTRNWAAMHEDSCLATRVRGEQSEELLDLRMACLGERREELKVLVNLFTNADADVVAHAVSAAQSLSPLSSCADSENLRAPVRPPADPARRARVEALRARLAEARALNEAGKAAQALPIVRSVVAEATPLGYRPLEGEALLLRGSVEHATGDDKAAIESLLQSVSAATAGHADLLCARALSGLVAVTSNQARFTEAHLFARLAQAALERAGGKGGGDELSARLHTNLGSLYQLEGKVPEALDHFRRALAIDEKLYGPEGADTLADLNNLGTALYSQGSDDAVGYYQRALAGYEKTLGALHPSVALVLDNLASSLLAMGRIEEARADYQRALAIAQKELGEKHPEVARAHNNLGVALRHLGRYEEARAQHERALAIYEQTLGPDHPDVAQALKSLGVVLYRQRHFRDALAMHQRALAIQEKALGPESSLVGASLEEAAFVMLELHQYADALARFSRALAIFEKAYGREHIYLATSLVGTGRAQIGLARPERALAPLERALAIARAEKTPDSLLLAQIWFAQAQALAAAGRDRARARELAEQARAAFAAAGDEAKPELSDVEAWLAHKR